LLHLRYSFTRYPILSTRNGLSQHLTSDGIGTLKQEECREDTYAEPSTSTRAQSSFSFFKSYYVDDTAFILLSRGELVAASKLIVSHFRRFGLTIHTGAVRDKSSKTEAIHFARPGQESSAADMEDIEIDEDRFISFCFKFKYLGSYFVPKLNDTADITERISQARKLFGSTKKQPLSNKQIPIDIRRRLYQATVVNIALWICESWALKEADRSKLEAFHHGCLRRMCGWTMWDVAEKRIQNERVRRTVANSPTMDSMMEMRRCRWLSKLSAMKARSQDLRGEYSAHGVQHHDQQGDLSRPYDTHTSARSRTSALKKRKGN
jgi:hypothetical protein